VNKEICEVRKTYFKAFLSQDPWGQEGHGGKTAYSLTGSKLVHGPFEKTMWVPDIRHDGLIRCDSDVISIS